ncbi:hypothetical protein M422DRAFT_49241 [Sphaerobolus stellatus SS14]|uniref:Alpha/beta hydrolase fold-3 domain-containing protein n=1 Tax=Sphaerobolus stellatus (strain SS14) TaxID=990650 RepID=A0A0C9UZP8_SPHS4|nr:hypothetical protein M422DRAFT_49241 [Sphaerobolus stellatus SS14]
MPSNSLPLPITYTQPFKALYISLRLASIFLLIPTWTLWHALIKKPHPSWTLKESLISRLIRWLMPINAQCGLHPLSLDKTQEVPDSKLKETSFVWIEPPESSIIRGAALDRDGKVKPVRVPGYVWPKGGVIGEGEGEGLVGLFFHGGGYMMGNGSEYFPETQIAREIYKRSDVTQILSVDYRLLHESCHPGQLLDALAAYNHLILKGVSPSRILVIGACAGGHLALMLTRYLYDEKVLPMPSGLMLFSPWLDMSIDLKLLSGDTTAIRPNTDIDILATSHIPNLRFLGNQPRELLNSPLLSANLAPPGSYKSYPRTFISIGECEAFRRECEQLHQLMIAGDVDVTLDVQPDAVHDFWGFGDLVPSVKAREALAVNVVNWIKRHGKGKMVEP